MSKRNEPPKTPDLKPLPKPVRPEIRKKTANSPAQVHRPRPALPAVNTDDFDLERAQRLRARRRKPEPTLTQAFIVFLSRIGNGVTARVKSLIPYPRGRKRKKPNAPHKTRGYREGVPTETRRPAGQNKKTYAQRVFYARIAGISALAVLVISLAVLAIWSAASKNAIAVYLEDELIGHIAMSREIDETAIQFQAVTRLEASLGAQVRVDQQVSIQPVSVSNKNIQSFSDILDQISRGFTYKIAASAIYVDGGAVTILRTQNEANAVADRLFAPYRNEHTVHAEFIDPWEYRTKLVDEDDLGTVEEALLRLDRKVRVMEDYVVQLGDTLGAIALRHNTTVDKICQDNPPLTPLTIIRPGEVYKLEKTKPFLSVRTVDEVPRIETIPMQTVEQENPMEHVNFQRVIEEGRDGEREILVRITRINGIQTMPEEIIGQPRIIINPIDRVVEVGTSEVQPDRR
jgi:hypothetical protein